MKRLVASGLAAVSCVCVVMTANAHYLWISVDRHPDENAGTNIYFEEAPAPGDGFYLDHFLGKSDVWIRTIENPVPAAIRAEEVKQGEYRWMRVAPPDADEYSVDAYGKFGVYEYGQTKVLLHYYARSLSVATHDAMHELGRAPQMKLDLVPHDEGKLFEFTLLWEGKPVAGRMVFVRSDKGFRKNMKTDVAGRIQLERPSMGTLMLRSSVEFATQGRENGEPYERVRHNITLLLPPGDASDGP